MSRMTERLLREIAGPTLFNRSRLTRVQGLRLLFGISELELGYIERLEIKPAIHRRHRVYPGGNLAFALRSAGDDSK